MTTHNQPSNKRVLRLFFALTCVAVLNSSSQSFAQTIQWQPEQQISFGSTHAFTPRVFAVGDTTHIFWIAPSPTRCYYVRSTDAGVSFSQPRMVYADSGVLLNSGSTRNISVNDNYVYILWRTCDTCSGNTFWATFRRSTDAGSTFEQYQKVFPVSGASALTASDSVVLFRWSNRSLTEDWIALSYDYGTTWQHIPFWFRNFQQLKLARNHLHMTESAEGTQSLEVAYRYSADLGTTWTNQLILSTIDNYTSDVTNAALKANSEGMPYVAWRDGKYGGTNPFVGSILLRHSTDTGTFWYPESLLTQIPSGAFPSIAIENDLVGVVWSNESQPFQGISLRFSTDRGETWLPHIAVSDSSRTASEADISLSRNRVYVVWSDRRTGVSQIYLRRGSVLNNLSEH